MVFPQPLSVTLKARKKQDRKKRGDYPFLFVRFVRFVVKTRIAGSLFISFSAAFFR
jgi:hypothetical protein